VRLKIIDLAGGAQPFFSDDRKNPLARRGNGPRTIQGKERSKHNGLMIDERRDIDDDRYQVHRFLRNLVDDH